MADERLSASAWACSQLSQDPVPGEQQQRYGCRRYAQHDDQHDCRASAGGDQQQRHAADRSGDRARADQSPARRVRLSQRQRQGRGDQSYTQSGHGLDTELPPSIIPSAPPGKASASERLAVAGALASGLATRESWRRCSSTNAFWSPRWRRSSSKSGRKPGRRPAPAELGQCLRWSAITGISRAVIPAYSANCG